MNKIRVIEQATRNVSLPNGRLPYASPQCQVIKLASEGFFCASVRPDAGGSGTGNWDNESEHDGGTIYFGDQSSVAPSKPFSAWSDDETEYDY